MRYVPPTLQTHLNGRRVPLCMCLKLVRRDGVTRGYTEHDKDLVVDGVTYRSAVGFDWTALRKSARLEDERTAIEGLLSSATGGISEADARAGLYNRATLTMLVVNWADTSMGVVPLKHGVLATLYPLGAGYVAEFQSFWSKLLKNEVTRVFTALCDRDLGDAKCGVALASFNGTVTSVTNNRVVVASAFIGPATPSDLVLGKFIFTSGDLTWFTNQIKAYDNGTKTFTLAVPFPSVPGLWNFTAFEGCNKKFITCVDRFDNALNFRGFDDVPEPDKRRKRPLLGLGGWSQGVGL